MKDFKQPFENGEDIAQSLLTADQKVRELVKHHSMALFGLATDLASQELEYQKMLKLLDQARKERVKQTGVAQGYKNKYISLLRRYNLICKELKELKNGTTQNDSTKHS